MLPSNAINPRKKFKSESGSVVTLLCDENDEDLNDNTDLPAVVNPSSHTGIQCEDNRKRKFDELTDEKSPIGRINTKLLDLYDDCLYNIFDPKHFPIMDLCTITQTCTRVSNIGNQVFVLKHKCYKIPRLYETDEARPYLYETGEARVSLKAEDEARVEAIRVLRVFGPLIIELHFDLFSYSNPNGIINAAKHCTSLKSLILKSYKVPDNRYKIVALGALFQRVQDLDIENVVIDGELENVTITPNGNLIDFFEACDSLIDLKVEGCDDFQEAIFSGTFLKLQHFSLQWLYNSDNIDGFLLRHKNLKSFALDVSAPYDHVPILKFIDKCSNLEKLVFGFYNEQNSDKVDTRL